MILYIIKKIGLFKFRHMDLVANDQQRIGEAGNYICHFHCFKQGYEEWNTAKKVTKNTNQIGLEDTLGTPMQ